MRTLLTLSIIGLGLAACDGKTGDRATGEPSGGDTGDTDDPASCGADVTPLVACVAWDGADPEGYPDEPLDLALAGTVTEVGSGAGAGCSYQDALLGDWDAVSLDDARWLRLVDESGTTWTVVLRIPELVGPAVGDEVAVDLDYTPQSWEGGLDQTTGQLTLSGGDGEVLAWVGAHTQAEALVGPDGVGFATGAVACEEEHDCGLIEAFALEVTAGSASADLASGESQVVGGWRVTNGSVVTHAPDDTCFDWGDAWAVAALMPAP